MKTFLPCFTRAEELATNSNLKWNIFTLLIFSACFIYLLMLSFRALTSTNQFRSREMYEMKEGKNEKTKQDLLKQLMNVLMFL